MASRSRGRLRGWAAAAALVCLLAAPAVAHGDTSPAATDGQAAGLRVYRDPATGEFTEPPADGPAAAQAGAGTAPSRLPALRQRPSPVVGGGVIVELGERFRSEVRARVEGPAPRLTCEGGGAARGAAAAGEPLW